MPDISSCQPNDVQAVLSDALTRHDKDSISAICRSPGNTITDGDRKRLWRFFLDRNGQSAETNLAESRGCEDSPSEESNFKESHDELPAADRPADCEESYENLSFQKEAKRFQKNNKEGRESDPKVKLVEEDLDFLALDDLKPHPDEAQVMLDVKRSFTLLSQFHMNGNSSYTTILSGDEVKAMRRKLYFFIVHMLRKYPCLHYYQGYHDIASVVLLVCGNDDESFKILESLTLYHLRDYMLRDISLSINHLKLIPMILENAEPSLFEIIRGTSPSYVDSDGLYYDYKFTPALSSVLTLFSHDLANMNFITKLWDFILSYKSVAVSAYFYSAAIIHFKDSIVTALGDSADVDSASLHTLISPAKLFDDLTESDLESILVSTSSLISRFPLESSPNSSTTYKVWFEEYNWKSVLNTSSNLGSGSNMILDSESLRQILEAQEEQSVCEAQHDAELFSKALLNAESALASSEEFEKSSLFSSSSMTSSVTSLTNSSIIKKIFASGNDKSSHPHSSIFKATILVGFAGILIHFLLRQSGWHFISKMPRFIHNSLGEKSLAHNEVARVVNVLGEVCSHMRDTIARESFDLGQVGLGTLKRHIYALGNLN